MIDQDDVRIIIRAPEMEFPLGSGIAALAVGFPVRNAIDSIGRGFVSAALQAAPDKMLEVMVERFDFRLHREPGVLRGQKCRLGQPGIVTRHLIDAPAFDAVIVVRAQQRLAFHVPLRKQTVVPLIRVAVLTSGDKGRTLADERLYRFCREKLKHHLPTIPISYRQPVLAQAAKPYLID